MDIQNNLYAIKPKNKENKKYKGIYIVKDDVCADKNFSVNKCLEYCHEKAIIPNELKKNILFFKDDISTLTDIILLGEKKYLIKINDKLFKYIFDKEKNEYLIEQVKLPDIKEDENDEDNENFEIFGDLFKKENKIKKVYLLKNKDILIMTKDNLHIYTFNNKKNELKNCRTFKDLLGDNIFSNEVGYYRDLPIIELDNDNGNIIFCYDKKLIIISLITKQVQAIINFDDTINICKYSNNIIKISYFWSIGNTHYLDINKMKFIRHEKLDLSSDEPDVKGTLLDNETLVFNGSNFFGIINIRTKDILYYNENNNFKVKYTFLLNKEEKVFGVCLVEDNKIKLVTYKLN